MNTKSLRGLAASILLLLATIPAQSACYQWSKTASSNATADPTINWAEGMSPSSVNDSARAMMARLAECRDDISGALTTTGTGSAYVLATNQGFDSLAHMDGAMIAFVPNVTNTGNVSLVVDGLSARAIRSQTGSAGDLGSGVLIAGTPYVVTYKNATTEFILQGFVGSPYAVPLGSFLFHSSTTAPNSNFIFPIGQAISRTTYAAYFAMVGTTFGVGDGTTTFNVPDLRSRIPLPLATMGGGDPGRVTTAGSGVDGASTGAVGGAQNVTIAQANLPNVTLATDIPAGQGAHVHGPGGGTTHFLNAGGVGTANSDTGGAAATTTTASAVLPEMSGTTPLGGSGTALPSMPPVMVLPLILRVL